MVPRRHRVRCVIIYRKDKGSQALVFTLPIKCSKYQRAALLMASAPAASPSAGLIKQRKILGVW